MLWSAAPHSLTGPVPPVAAQVAGPAGNALWLGLAGAGLGLLVLAAACVWWLLCRSRREATEADRRNRLGGG